MDLEDDTGSDGSDSVGYVSTRSSQEIAIEDLPRSVRISIDESLRDVPPPTYSDALLPPASLSRLKLPVQPRPEEGKEVLPQYSTALCLQNVFYRKMELENAIHRSQDRNWGRVVVILQGTALKFYKCSTTSFFSGSGGRKHNADFPLGTKMGILLKSYNMQHAEVGIAADYQKRQYVIRMRAEADQFLLSCHKIETFVGWLQALSTAIGLAPPLEDRQYPSDRSIPRSRRSSPRRRPLAETTTPNPAAEIPETAETVTSSPNISAASSTESLAQAPTRSVRRESPSNNVIASQSRRAQLALQSSTPPSRSMFNRNSNTNPNVTSDGKWRPHHHWTQFYDMLYAKRCMAVLAAKSPRKSNFVIKGRTLWWIDWSNGELKRCAGNGAAELAEHRRPSRHTPTEDPPEYYESVRTESMSTSSSLTENIPLDLSIEEIQPVTFSPNEFDTSGKVVERIQIPQLNTIGA